MMQSYGRWMRNMPAARWPTAALVLAALVWSMPAVRAQDAAGILKKMTDYVTSLKTFSVTFDSDIEVVTPELQKIQFTNSGQVTLSRPDKLRASRHGGYVDVELVFDGKTFTLLNKDGNAYAQTDLPGSVDDLINGLRDKYNVALPGADLLLSNAYDQLTADVTESKHVGQGVIDGVDCEHLAFRTAEVDWQIWIETGDRPIPRKFVITSKAVTGAPQYTLRIRQWQSDAPVAADAFAFKPPTGAKKVELADLRDTDEVPPGQLSGGKK